MGFLITIVALSIVIFLHELGHMLSAKKFGISVYEFSIGMGPKIVSKLFGGTLYALRLLPFGGFVKVAGLNDEDDAPAPDAVSFYTRPLWQRCVVIAAGSIMNLISGFLIFLFIFLVWGTRSLTPVIDSVVANSPAAQAGLQSGDKALKLNNLEIKDVMNDLIKPISLHRGQESMDLLIEREGQEKHLTVIPRYDEKKKISMIGMILKSQRQHETLISAPGLALNATWIYTKMVFTSLKMLFTGAASLKDLSGPVGIVQFASFELQKGLDSFFHVIAMISISLGIINLMPIPVLDGGHLLFLFIEGIRGKAMGKKVETIISNVCAALLIALMVFVVVNDVFHWKSREKLLHTLQQKK